MKCTIKINATPMLEFLEKRTKMMREKMKDRCPYCDSDLEPLLEGFESVACSNNMCTYIKLHSEVEDE